MRCLRTFNTSWRPPFRARQASITGPASPVGPPRYRPRPDLPATQGALSAAPPPRKDFLLSRARGSHSQADPPSEVRDCNDKTGAGWATIRADLIDVAPASPCARRGARTASATGSVSQADLRPAAGPHGLTNSPGLLPSTTGPQNLVTRRTSTPVRQVRQASPGTTYRSQFRRRIH